MKGNAQSEGKANYAACKHELQFTHKAGKQRNHVLNFWSYFAMNKAKARAFFQSKFYTSCIWLLLLRI